MAAPTTGRTGPPRVLHHFSEDPTIERFVPHVPATNPTHPPAVWAIDGDHAPLYWFPRDCPRVTAWPRSADEAVAFRRVLATTARRLHVIPADWFEHVRTATVYRYDLSADDFEPWAEASGQWISDRTVRPVAMEPIGDLLALHRTAEIELRLVPSLAPVAELVIDDRWDFSIVRLANATT